MSSDINTFVLCAINFLFEIRDFFNKIYKMLVAFLCLSLSRMQRNRVRVILLIKVDFIIARKFQKLEDI